MKRASLVAVVIAGMCTAGMASAQVDEILQSIEKEQAVSNVQPKGDLPPPSSSAKKQDTSKQGKALRSATKYWLPKDRLPGNIAGQYLIGDFVVFGESPNGHAQLVALADKGGVFTRTFEVENSSSGLSPGQIYPSGKEPRISFTRENPLIFTRSGVLGYYMVRTTR